MNPLGFLFFVIMLVVASSLGYVLGRIINRLFGLKWQLIYSAFCVITLVVYLSF